ncbi:hypothetical protein MATL_G00228630 [Megalops atlanticus]|uniref:MHC class I-like antigen recognition-like domain-containing protein n=1 Tax=Megalops atlanticus TaxID=7932 RepID=A0A9D3PHJ9_MEGAT|nr:hypothetical protein MATL_G00228630 [Megalops atlanticus]
MIGVLIVLCGFHAGFAVTHVGKGCITGSSGVRDLPEVMVVPILDDETVAYFDSKTRKIEIRLEWVLGKVKDSQKYIDFYNVTFNIGIPHLINYLQDIMRLHGHSGGIHTLQLMLGCEVNEDGKAGEFIQFGYDGEDFTSLDISTVTWIAHSPQAVIFNSGWNHRPEVARFWKGILENQCYVLLQEVVDNGREILERKALPHPPDFLIASTCLPAHLLPISSSAQPYIYLACLCLVASLSQCLLCYFVALFCVLLFLYRFLSAVLPWLPDLPAYLVLTQPVPVFDPCFWFVSATDCLPGFLTLPVLPLRTCDSNKTPMESVPAWSAFESVPVR